MQYMNGSALDPGASARTPLRTAIVTETYPPEVNGVAMTVRAIVDGLRRRHHDVQLIRPRRDAADTAHTETRFQEVLTRGLPIPRYAALRMGLPCTRQLVQQWTATRPDVVHIATEGPLGWSALRAARQLGLPVSSDFRTNFHAYSQHYGIGWLHRPIMAYLRKFHNETQRTMVPTEALRRTLEASGFCNLSVVARGVDTQRFDPRRRSEALRREWGTALDDVVVACVGRLAPEKNLGVVLDAFEAMQRKSLPVRLVLVGDGPMRTELQARCPGAVLAGQRIGGDLAAHYASADLFLFPSLTETFGNVTVEAMASGLPVVAFHDAAAAQLIRSHENGVSVTKGDAAAFVAAAVGLAGDVLRRRKLGEAARHSAFEFGWDDVVRRFESVLLAVVREHEAAQGLPFGVTRRMVG